MNCEEGAAGWGEATPTPRWTYETTETIVSTIVKYLAPAVKGIDLWNFDGIHRAMERAISPGVTAGSRAVGAPRGLCQGRSKIDPVAPVEN